MGSSAAESVGHRVCPNGLSAFVVTFDGDPLVVNGLIDTRLNAAIPGRFRRALRTHIIPIEQVVEWRTLSLRLAAETEQDIALGIKESISSLHDIKTAVSLVLRNAEGLVDEIPGADFAERVENADPKLKALLKSVSLLSTRMSMASIVANPEACSFGRKHAFAIYKVFDKMCRLFEESASRKRVGIRMAGRSFNLPAAYDSLESLALVLVDNAVKYSSPDSEVVVRVNDVNGDASAVTVEVESLGPLVPDDKRDAIFDKGYRCPNAQDVAGGSGLGLYIARLIAEAHGFKISYRGTEVTADSNVGQNIFSFRIK